MNPTAAAATDPDAVLDAYLDASALLARLELSRESRQGVRENLGLLLRLSELFADPPFDPSLDPAPVFRL